MVLKCIKNIKYRIKLIKLTRILKKSLSTTTVVEFLQQYYLESLGK